MEYEEIKLKNVNKDDFKFLYDLLAERNSKTNISHKKMPSYKQHIEFIFLKPYKQWNIIIKGVKKIGAIYLSYENEIGITIKKGFEKQEIEDIALKKLMEKNNGKRFLANVSPKNHKLKKFFLSHDFKLIQNTYELDLRESNYEK